MNDHDVDITNLKKALNEAQDKVDRMSTTISILKQENDKLRLIITKVNELTNVPDKLRNE
jgi:hypothetical protein